MSDRVKRHWHLPQEAVVFWRPLGQVFYTVPFGLEVVVAVGVVGSLVLWAEELRKLIARRQESRPAVAAPPVPF